MGWVTCASPPPHAAARATDATRHARADGGSWPASDATTGLGVATVFFSTNLSGRPGAAARRRPSRAEIGQRPLRHRLVALALLQPPVLQRRKPRPRDVRRLIVLRLASEGASARRRAPWSPAAAPRRGPRSDWASMTAQTNPPAQLSTYPSTPLTCPARNTPGRARSCIRSSSTRGASTNVFRCTLPKRRISACSRPGIVRKTRRLLRPGHARLEADEVVRRRRRVLRAQLHDGERALRPSAGPSSPTGFIGPKASVISPRDAITSMGRHPSK